MTRVFRPGIRLALDWGDARIGVAKCDPAGTLAFPYATIPAGATEIAALVALVAEETPLELILGLPRSLSGGEGPAAVKMRERAASLASALAAAGLSVALRLVDERLTTVTATRQLRESGKRARQQRSLIDAASAATILEHALAVERARGEAPGELVSPARESPEAAGDHGSASGPAPGTGRNRAERDAVAAELRRAQDGELQ